MTTEEKVDKKQKSVKKKEKLNGAESVNGGAMRTRERITSRPVNCTPNASSIRPSRG